MSPVYQYDEPNILHSLYWKFQEIFIQYYVQINRWNWNKQEESENREVEKLRDFVNWTISIASESWSFFPAIVGVAASEILFHSCQIKSLNLWRGVTKFFHFSDRRKTFMLRNHTDLQIRESGGDIKLEWRD